MKSQTPTSFSFCVIVRKALRLFNQHSNTPGHFPGTRGVTSLAQNNTEDAVSPGQTLQRHTGQGQGPRGTLLATNKLLRLSVHVLD